MSECVIEKMPSKKKKYNARFPAGRIKKIMQTDEEVGKVAQAVPVIISRTLELFVESLLTKAMQITSAKNAKTLSPSHMKQCILSESRFDFLKELVAALPDMTNCETEDSAVPLLSSPHSDNNYSSYPDDSVEQEKEVGRERKKKAKDELPEKGWKNSPSSQRLAEGPSQSQISKMTAPTEEAVPISLQAPTAAPTRINANFYKENEEVHESAVTTENSSGSRVNSAMMDLTTFVSQYPQTDTKVGIDEDYDTT